MNLNGSKPVDVTKPCLISWVGNTVFVPCEVKRYSKRIPKESLIDFDAYEIKRKGLLEITLNSVELPCHYKRFVNFVTAIKYLSLTPGCREVLSAPPKSLSVARIVWFFNQHEQFVTSQINRKNLKILGAHFRAYFKRISEPMMGGTQLSDIQFRSTLEDKSKQTPKRLLISEVPDKNASIGFRGPISDLPHKDLLDLEAKALVHLKDRLGRIESACWQVIEEHIALAALIKELKSSELQESIVAISTRNKISLENSSWQNIRWRVANVAELRLDPELAGKYVLHWLDAIKIHSNLHLTADAIGMVLNETVFKDSVKLSYDTNHIYLSDYYLSHLTLLSCQYLMQIYTGWNPDTVRELTVSSIELESNNCYVIRPYKPKTDQYNPPKHFGPTEERPRKIIELLLAHNENVNTYATRLNNSLFVGLQRNFKAFGLFNPKIAHATLVDCFNLPHFAPSQLRDQAANTKYLESGRDVLLLKEFLGHADLLTVDTYLNHSIQRVLNVANMSEFTRRLDESITLCVSNTPAKPTAHGLLFPIGNVAEHCLSDEWLNSECNIEIDANQIAHCIWQRQYYIENFQRLRSENARQFAVVHLPRIIFCTALYHVIMQSKNRFIVDKINSFANLQKNGDGL